MENVSFAAVLATTLLLSFPSTRALGAVGVFVLVCIKPLIGLLLVAAGVSYVLVRRRPGDALARLLPPSSRANRNKGNGLVSLLVLILLGGALLVLVAEPPSDELYRRFPSTVRSAPSEEVIVLRTPGGLLEVSRIEATEVIDTRFTHSILGVEVGETLPRIRVPAVYRYGIELEDELRVLRTEKIFTVVAPTVRPSLPVAVDFAGIEKNVAGTFILLPFTGDEDIEALERQVSEKLAAKASSPDYIERQREKARETVREFVLSWLVEQTRWKDARYEDVRVLFADEPTRSIASIGG